MIPMALSLPRVLEPETEQHSPTATEQASDLRVTADQLRRWSAQTALAIIDQGLTAAAGFGVNVLLARWLPAASYGAFAVAFAGYLFVSGFHNVLLLEPLSILGPARYSSGLPAYFRAQITVHVFLVGILSGVVLLAGIVVRQLAAANPLAGALIGGGLALPLMLLLWLVRRICYILKKPGGAGLGSAAYLLLVGATLALAWAFGEGNPLSGFLLMGAASLVSSGLLLWRLKLGWGENSRGSAWSAVLRENWTYGRWLLGSAVLFATTSQLQTVLAAAFLGLGAAGVLRAMQIPSLVMTQIITAAGLLVLPVFSYDFGRQQMGRLRKHARIVSMGLASAALLFVLILAIFATPTERLLFGGKYASYAWFMPVLALIPVLNGFAMGYSVAL